VRQNPRRADGAGAGDGESGVRLQRTPRVSSSHPNVRVIA
jgi:hypothetical protein